MHILEEIPLGVSAVDAPPVVDKDVEDAEDEDEERGRPLGLEADGNHRARGETDERHKEPSDAPLAAEGEANEEENEQDASRKEEASKFTCQENRSISRFGRDLLFLAVVLRKGGETSKEFLARVHRIAEDHEEATDDAEVAEEEVEVENEAITECLDNDNTEKTANCIFSVSLCDDCPRTDEHHLTQAWAK